MATGYLSLIIMNEFPDLPLEVAEDRARFVNTRSQIKDGVFLELLLVFLTALITNGLVFRKTEPIRFFVIGFTFDSRMVRTGVNN
jgi:hypothetical protein